MHTSNSDGRESAEEVLARAGHLAGLAFTDHSAISFDDRLAKLAREQGVELLFPGVEISTMHEGRKYHVLGYGHELLDPGFLDYAFSPTRIKNEVYAVIIDELRRDGYALPPFEDMMAGRGLAAEPVHPAKWMMSKAVISRYLVLDGIPGAAAQALLTDRYERRKSRHPDRYLPTRDVVARVRAHRGVASIAHAWWECPAGLNTSANVVATLRLLRDDGLVGLEVSTRHLTVGTEESRRQVAAELGLLPMSGSDYHANGKTELGQFGMSGAELDQLRQTAADLDLIL
ncbi:MAG TPA: hypothetical protein VHZ33_09545 [Trebonia sp.]|nr:hypothetical protein [Trebonia sp.]